MEAIGSAAAIAQILGQVIYISQQVELARQSVRAGSELLANTATQLSQLLKTIHEVKQQPILGTSAVQAQLEVISSITEELRAIIEEMELLQKKSTLRQHLLALGRRTRDEAKLNDVLKRLENAKIELGLRINVAHAGVTGEIAQGMGSLMESSQRSQSEVSGYMLIEGNESHEEADQCNGIIGLDVSRTSNTAQIRDNMARGKSRQQNLITSGCNSLSSLGVFK